MHEMAIAQSMLDLALEQAEKAGARKLGKINLIIGEMTGVVGKSMQFYFDFISKSTIAEGATLVIKTVPMTARCHECNRQFELGELDWACPHCKSSRLEIVGGKELFVESIEVE